MKATITIQCPHCNKVLIVPDFLAEHEAVCPFCNGGFTIGSDRPDLTMLSTVTMPLKIGDTPKELSLAEEIGARSPARARDEEDNKPIEIEEPIPLAEASNADDEAAMVLCPNCGDLAAKKGGVCSKCKNPMV